MSIHEAVNHVCSKQWTFCHPYTEGTITLSDKNLVHNHIIIIIILCKGVLEDKIYKYSSMYYNELFGAIIT